MNLEAARAYALNRLENDVPSNYDYHHIGHTRDVVVPGALNIGRSVNLDETDMILLETAAWFHDIGFIYSTKGHELTGCVIAAAVLSQFGYTPEHIELIQSMIMATLIPQSPPNLLAAILCDADLDVLGHPDFPTLNNALRQEMAMLGNTMSDAMWFSSQWRFVVEHRYHTEMARERRREGKRTNLQYLLSRISEIQRDVVNDDSIEQIDFSAEPQG